LILSNGLIGRISLDSTNGCKGMGVFKEVFRVICESVKTRISKSEASQITCSSLIVLKRVFKREGNTEE